MKNQMLKYASLLLVAAMMLAAVDSASASNKRSSKNKRYDSRDRDCDRDRNDRDCDRQDRDRDCDDDDGSGSPSGVTPAIGISPVGSVIITTETSITVQVPFTAPANSSAVIVLLQDGVPVGSFSVPSATTTGTSAFTVNLAGINNAVLQAQLNFITTTGGDDDDDDDRCDNRRSGHSSKKKSKGHKGCHGDDDDDDGGTSTVTTLLSDTLTITREDGGPVSG
ncbi:MAG: hypothetical protein ACO1QS_06725 [Verrucomicrobiota bacterium]